MREGQLAAFDVKMKATAKRGVYSRGKLIKQLGSIKNDTEAIKGTTHAIHEDTKVSRNVIEGGEQPRKDGQSDKARIKQLRVQKRLIDNQIGDLKESESKRLHTEKAAQHETVQQAAETAKSSLD